LKRRHVRLFAAILALLALLATACGDDGETSEPDTTDGTTETTAPDATTSTLPDPAALADREAEFHFAINYSYNSLDPHKSLSPGGDEAWLKPLYDMLIQVVDSPDGGVELGPQLATSYEVSADGLSVEFVLRDDVTFQDGTPFNADAVKANLERAMGPDSAVASQLSTVESVEVVDDTHVVVHLKEQDPAFIWAMAQNAVGSMISPAAFGTDLNAKPVGSGPFKLVSAVQNGDVVFEPWDGYWDEDAALVKKYTISSVFDENARFNGLRSGTYDAVYVGYTLDDQAQELAGEGYHYIQTVVASPLSLLMNSSKPPFDDVRVRQAVSMALSRQEISDELLSGVAPPAFGQPFASFIEGHDPALEVDPYDVDAARALIEEAGAEGASVSIISVAVPPLDLMAQVVQQSLNDIGLNVELAPLAFADARAAWPKGEHHGMVNGLRTSFEPGRILNVAYLGGDNPAPPPAELVEMANEARLLPLGSEERTAAYKEISAWMVENPVHVPITGTVQSILAQPKVLGADTLMKYAISRLDPRHVGIEK
jgi:peptide/nickel transport system substrate-binding protein